MRQLTKFGYLLLIILVAACSKDTSTTTIGGGTTGSQEWLVPSDEVEMEAQERRYSFY